jgi:hypothetical protein
MKQSRIRFSWRDRTAHKPFRTAVSLHSHTMHSQESLGFIPRYSERIPVLAWEMRRQARQYLARTGKALDYTRGFWTPPLPGREAYGLERRHIEEKLGLPALVSLTDHDNIEAGCQLRLREGMREAPISVEWTVPVGATFFHVGVHNLPPAEAHSITAEMNRYTGRPSKALLQELLASLNGYPDTLIVLNHPLWDQGGVGADGQQRLLHELFHTCEDCFHAVEVNGLRPWPENRAAAELACAWDRPVVSGGDRHGCEPSSIVNLTGATSLSEFVSEVRAGRSEVLVLDHYREPRRFRLWKTMCDIMSDYPELPGREHWDDRMHCTLGSGAIVPLSQVWNGDMPRVIRYFQSTLRLTENRGIRRLVRLCSTGGSGM